MTRLAQALALEQAAKGHADTARERATQLLHPSNFPQMTGLEKTYKPHNENATERDQLPPKSTKVQIRVEEVLADLAQAWSDMLDVTLTVETGNAETRGTIKVGADDRVLLDDVPVTWLLGLETRLKELGKVLDRLPELDPARAWEPHERGLSKTNEEKTPRSIKVPRSFELAPPDAHGNPAQVKLMEEDIPHGTYTTIYYSGMLHPTRIRELRDRQRELLKAVKLARHEANSQEVRNRRAGAVITGFLLDG